MYNFPGIQNVNGIYDFDLISHLELKVGKWHHTAVVFRQAHTVGLYTDGKKAAEIAATGRDWAEKDRLNSLLLGSADGEVLRIDELAVLDRARDAGMIADYFQGITRLSEYQ